MVLGVEAIEAQYTFVGITFSGTIPGIFVGAALADHYGGYKGKGMGNALTLCCVFGFFMASFALALSLTFEK